MRKVLTRPLPEPSLPKRARLQPVMHNYALRRVQRNARFCRTADWGWRPGRVYFLTLLEPSRDDRTLTLTARSASRLSP
jgi:hypothetical protein